MRPNKQMESGRTMLEMLGVLGILGIIMYGALSTVSFGVTMYRLNAQYLQVEEIAKGIKEMYYWHSSYPDNANDILNAVCSEQVTPCENAQIKAPWDTSISTVESPENSGIYRVRITVSGMPTDICERMNEIQFQEVSKSGNCGNSLVFTL